MCELTAVEEEEEEGDIFSTQFHQQAAEAEHNNDHSSAKVSQK